MRNFPLLIKRGLIICYLLSTVTKSQAQVGDLEAKLAFQKITDAYESSAYYNAAVMSEELEGKMGKWNPRTLYTYLESVYKCYNGGNEANNKFGSANATYARFSKLSNLFFTLVDKAEYPKEKYDDMITAQQYFADMVKKTEYQNTRTPEKAIAFLNDCAIRFRNYSVGDGKDFKTHVVGDDPSMAGTPYIRFRIDSNYLRIVMVSKTRSRLGGKYNMVMIWNDIIDLKHAPAIDEGKTTVDDRVYLFSHHFFQFDRQGDFDKVDTIALAITWKDDKQVAAYKSKYSKTILDYTPKTIMQYPLDLLFLQTDKDFQEGKYWDRISDAYNYLLTYYPKEKTPVVVTKKKEDSKALGF